MRLDDQFAARSIDKSEESEKVVTTAAMQDDTPLALRLVLDRHREILVLLAVLAWSKLIVPASGDVEARDVLELSGTGQNRWVGCEAAATRSARR